MNARTFNTLGGFQSMLFCIGIYVIALFFSIFICSAIFKAVNSRGGISTVKVTQPVSGSKVLVAAR
ncbi:hypothetical protein [Flavihumibacter solisilvae]|uniref:Uncharacterized protein n=1 Tax=Flavihumibacter solisilvae TaxID=1349421 RepID=A0A0C1L0U0_9BACT|nr:hypothetical protein [Flavihumibacter solisilvae]KIC93216.1 hypothetical protein OI18_18350 [Flavihumibacter solisilvae]